jgi:gliding motility-associated-like protein
MTYDTVYVDVSGTATICDGETTDITFTLTGTPPFDLTYMTPTGQVVENGITGNSFVVTVSDDGNYFPVSIVGSGCTGNVSSNQATVTVIPLPNINIGSSATYCVGETMTDLVATSANGGSIFWWDNQANVGDTNNAIGQGTSLNIDVLGITTTTTFYAQEFSIPDGCGGSVDQVVITILPIPTAPVVSGTQEYCDGDTYTALTVSLPAGSSGIWTDGMGGILANNTNSYTPQNLVVGPNTVCVMEDNGTCTGDSTCIAINLKPTPTAPGVSGDTSYCTNDVITPLTGTANLGGFITWSTGDIGNQITPGGTVGTTTYCANETLNGCTGPDSCVNVTVYVDPSITVPTSATICIGDSVLICADNNGIFPPDVIQWSHGPTDECIYLGPPSDEQYVVCLTNPACGTVCDTIDIIVKPLPVVTAGDDQTTGLGGEVTMWADGALSYDWSPYVTCQDGNCENVYAVPSATTTYIVTGTDENGCVNTDSVVITINGEMQLYVPNVFSPNADGVNDRLFVMGPRLSQFSWAIFDRQGKKLYESTDQKAGWNGTYNGEPLPQQVVTYIIQGVDVLGREVKTGGNVMLSR